VCALLQRKAKEEAEALKAHREELERAAEKKRKADNLALAIQADELAFSAAPPSSVKESALQRIMPGPKKKPATKIFAGGFETEEAAMQAAIFKHQKAKLGMPEGISHLRQVATALAGHAPAALLIADPLHRHLPARQTDRRKRGGH
jgi:hypothetical protein